MNIRVLIKNKKHPWAGHSGIIVGRFKTVFGVEMIKVRLDNGIECGVVEKDLSVLRLEE